MIQILKTQGIQRIADALHQGLDSNTYSSDQELAKLRKNLERILWTQRGVIKELLNGNDSKNDFIKELRSQLTKGWAEF